MTATVITWVDGRVQTEAADEHFARIDAQLAEAAERTHARHVANMLGLTARHMRADYLCNLKRREGADAAEAVRVAFLAAWDARPGRRP